jgi:hypothetical protein
MAACAAERQKSAVERPSTGTSGRYRRDVSRPKLSLSRL